MAISFIDTASTLSVNFKPGQDTRILNTNSSSIFTFGDYRLETEFGPSLAGELDNGFTLGSFSTLESLKGEKFERKRISYVENSELSLPKNDPYSYAYYSNFYSLVATSINNIIKTHPYALLSYDNSSGRSVYDYYPTTNQITGEKFSNFKIPVSAITNQGDVLLNSGGTYGTQSLVNNLTDYGVQLSGASNDNILSITSYGFTSFDDANFNYLEFTVKGHLLDSSYHLEDFIPIYIRPKEEVLVNFKNDLTRLEKHILYDGDFKYPNIDDDGEEDDINIKWPTTIDGFNPDVIGQSYDDFETLVLKFAQDIDFSKTDMLLKTVVPESYLELDTDDKIFTKLIQVYGQEFDEMKQYIDSIVYAHSINYNLEETVPLKFLNKLSNLLGWDLSNAFNELDLFSYLAGEADDEGVSFAEYGIELWKRILVNINWLYKKKGTRDALQFVFKLIGAPDSLVRFDEFVYNVNNRLTFDVDNPNYDNFQVDISFNNDGSATVATGLSDGDGYPSILKNPQAFQEGGPGRGNGDSYFDFYAPEFDLERKVDNFKVVSGTEIPNFEAPENSIYSDPEQPTVGSRNKMNSKEVCLALDPASAIERNVFEWYKLSGTCWTWGSLAPPFSALTTPFEYVIDNCDFVAPEQITGMTFTEYTNFIYTSNINPRNRKTNHQSHNNFIYPELKKIYMNYYLLSDPKSNMLTFKRLESFLNLLEVQFQDYIMQLLPATTILECGNTLYRNTVFQRQRYVYKDGLNDGSEFRVELPPLMEPSITPIKPTVSVNDYQKALLNPISISSSVNSNIESCINGVSITSSFNFNNIYASSNGHSVSYSANTTYTSYNGGQPVLNLLP